jgi:hypothetical protein
MTQLAPCPACKRHVATREIACPFCTHRFTPRAQHVALVGRVTRAAVFSAALAACAKDKPPPSPAPPPTQGSDDLEQMLDPSGSAAVAPTAPPLIDAAVSAPDAAIVVDAGVPDAGVVIKKKQKKREQVEETVKVPIDNRHLAKPYGAPPARRRVV